MLSYQEIFDQAHRAGLAAAHAAIPTPMAVVNHDRVVDVVADGVCGFAWVKIRPGNSRLAKAAKLILGARKSYTGGVDLWISHFNQSYTRKYAYASAFADVVRELTGETSIYADGRLD